jgi:hypothetical protein
MTVIAWPTDLLPTRREFYLESNTLLVTSPFSFASQAVSRLANRWVAELTFDPMDRARAGRVRGLTATLDGGLNEVLLYDFLQPTPRGPATAYAGGTIATTWGGGTSWGGGTVWGGITPPGTPQVRTAGAIGDATLATWGWAASITPLLAGDYVGLGGYLYMLTEDAAADLAGRATLALRPRLRAVATPGAALVTTRPTARFRLADGQQGRSTARGGAGFSSAVLRFVESLP